MHLKKGVGPQNIQESNIYNQGKFNVTDNLFNFVCSQNNKLFLPH